VNALEDLRRIEVFSDLSEEKLAWIAAQSRFLELKPGERLFEEGDPADTMMGVIEGEMNARREKGPPDGHLFVTRAGQVGAMLPFSRMQTFPVTGRAVVRTRLALFPASLFPELFRRIPELEPRFVAALADRVRRTTRDESHREALVALGKLAAGLAHELNNPAAAVARAAAEMRGRLDELRQRTLGLGKHGLDSAALGPLAELVHRRARAQPLDTLARAELEEELGDWLQEHGIERAWAIAESFVDAGITTAELADAVQALPVSAVADVLGWAEAGLAADLLVADIGHAVARITTLVGAVKSYSHMDQAPDRVATDIGAGLQTTLSVLGHKLRAKGVEVVRDFASDLPVVPAYSGELNQVWTNLIDNAIDAVPPGGRITLRTARETERILVEVADNGAGIPAEIQTRVWEPFFTTKDVGQGSGLGLDIVHRIVVHRHGGEVRVDSVPGHTRFRVWIPLAVRGATDARGG
jgi:signal transduction histidine kinase